MSCYEYITCIPLISIVACKHFNNKLYSFEYFNESILCNFPFDLSFIVKLNVKQASIK